MLKKIKELIKNNPILFDYTKQVIRLLNKNDSIYQYIKGSSYLTEKNVSFLQIGASDGIRNDPFREHIIKNNWSGVFVEPVPWAYKKLKQNYQYKSGLNLTFLNAAVSIDNKERLDLYTFKEEFLMNLPMTERVNYQQKSSFNKQWVIDHAPTEAVVEKIIVPCFSVTEIVNKYLSTKDLNLLAIDAEGLDAEIIMSIEFSTTKPKVIFFEYHTLGEKYDELKGFLLKHGYRVMVLGKWDAVAELIEN